MSKTAFKVWQRYRALKDAPISIAQAARGDIFEIEVVHPGGGVSMRLERDGSCGWAASTRHIGTALELVAEPQTILDEAKALIYGDRHDAYGEFAGNAERLAALWNSYLAVDASDLDLTNRPIVAEDVPAMLALLKVMRLAEDPTHRDSWLDIAGYVGCAGKLDSLRPAANT